MTGGRVWVDEADRVRAAKGISTTGQLLDVMLALDEVVVLRAVSVWLTIYTGRVPELDPE